MSKEIIQYDAQEAAALAEEKINSISSVMDLKVNSTPRFEQAGEAMKVLKETKKFLKEKKDSILDPLNIAVKNIKSLFEPAEKKCAEAEAYLKGQIETYNNKLIAEETKRTAEAAARVANGESIEKVVKKVENTQQKIKAIPTYTVWEVEVLDFAKVPDEFKTLNESKAKDAGKTGIAIPGLRVYPVEKIRNSF